MKKIAVILNLNKQYDRYLVAGIARYAREKGDWSLYLEDDPHLRVPDFTTWKGDGVIADLDDENLYKELIELKIPVVGLGGGYGLYNHNGQIPYIYTDNKGIAELGAEHLYDRGFRNFAFSNIAPTAINGWAAEREDFFTSYLNAKGCNCSSFSEEVKHRDWEGMLKNLMDWLDQLPKPLGLMAANDSKARHVLEACRRLGIRVPEDIAVVGVDDDPMMCKLASPSLTSVIQGTDKLGYESARLLDRKLNGEKDVQGITVEPLGISIRESTDILAIDDELIAQSLSYIRTNACNFIQVEDVSRQCGVSRSTLEKRFKSVLGLSVHHEIAKVQIKRALNLLVETSLPLKTVAERAGFSTVQYMTMKVKEKTGKTPKNYRMSSKKSIDSF
ncbi:MAG: DNA-binding transcriptional regulator [Lentisphaeraceae bacterium]|nr:DNA-binding transcriptional regulator [Lentisphaeraceae bacterium]